MNADLKGSCLNHFPRSRRNFDQRLYVLKSLLSNLEFRVGDAFQG